MNVTENRPWGNYTILLDDIFTSTFEGTSIGFFPILDILLYVFKG